MPPAAMDYKVCCIQRIEALMLCHLCVCRAGEGEATALSLTPSAWIRPCMACTKLLHVDVVEDDGIENVEERKSKDEECPEVEDAGH
jgi:hypothetical protein